MKGLKIFQSDFPVEETVNRLIHKIEEAGWHVFARIDHSKQARDEGLELRPTQVVLFGNPLVGTLLMQDKQTAAIDLPVKALVWRDDEGKILVAHNTTAWLKDRHQLTDDATVKKIGEVMESVCHFAAKG